MQLLLIQCRHHLKFFQHASLLSAFSKHRTIYTRLSTNRLSQPFSQTPATNSSVADNTARAVTFSSAMPPEEPVSSQNSILRRSQVASMSSSPQREIINPRSPITQFGIIAGVFLRHTARSLGFLVLPDGYVRVSDMLAYGYFARFNFLEFAHLVKNDPMDRFQMALLPDLVNGILQKVWWVRAKYGHTMPSVSYHTQRISRAWRLRTAYYITNASKWDLIREQGIPEGPDCFVRLFDKSYCNLFRDYVPVHTKALCISINPKKAETMGVKFFYTADAQLIATGDRNQVIPFRTLNNVVELEFTKEALK